jgi:hypothetical protein
MDPHPTANGELTARASRSGLSLLHPAIASIGPWLAQAGLPFLLIAYLGLRGGGYDIVVRSEVGIAAWWIVLLGAAVGALPLARLSRRAWIGLGVLAAFALWTALGISWSESAERSVAELGRVATLMGLFTLTLSVQGSDGLRRMVYGVAAGVTLIAGVALLSRFEPSWFPELEAPEVIPESQARLHYPLDYWNGLAALVAIGMPLLVALVTSARSTVARALAAAAVPALALTAFFTLSRGGALAALIALAVLFALHPGRLALAAYSLPALAGSAILVAAASQRDDLTDGLTTATASSQGDEMLAMTLVVCAGSGLLTAALALADRHGVAPEITIPRRFTARWVAAIAGVAIVIALVAGLPGAVGNAWEDFKDPAVPTADAARFDSASGSGRYQFWEAAADAGAGEPLTGIGPGTYEFYWAREGTLPTFIRDAHSLYLETFAELGIVGLVLVLAVVASPFALGTRRLFSLDRELRILVAGALAGCAAFVVAAGVDWAWELTVLPVVFALLAAAIIGRPAAADEPEPDRRPAKPTRFVLAGLSVAGMIAIAIPMASADALLDSQANVQGQDLSGALGDARSAEDIEPYAAAPDLQQAMVLELQGDLTGALEAARAATEAEPTNWRTWLVLSRLEAQAGNAEGSVEAYREARSLNPRSAIFQ